MLGSPVTDALDLRLYSFPMPKGLCRIQHTGLSHFITFSCYRRQQFFNNRHVYDLFPICLERMRKRFQMRVYGYVVMPEHVHILVSEPDKGTLADAIHFLKLSFSKRLRSQVSAQKKGANLGHEVLGPFWQKRYYDRNVRDNREFIAALKYIHRNPLKRGLVEKPEDWSWSSYRHYALGELGTVQIESPVSAWKRRQIGNENILTLP